MNVMGHKTRRTMFSCLFGASLIAMTGSPLLAQSPDGSFSNSQRYMPKDGEVLYRTSCQACHMPAGEGAAGAGIYPALAKNVKLRTARYPVFLVVNGQKGMPPFGDMMNDEQLASVINYVRTHFGNDYKDIVSASDIKAVRR